MDSKDSHEEIKQRISDGEYSLFDKIMYGGLGYGYLCVPSDVFKWIFTGIFPPIGIFIHYTIIFIILIKYIRQVRCNSSLFCLLKSPDISNTLLFWCYFTDFCWIVFY